MPTEFTAHDRCDGCSARAKYLVLLASGKTIQLCGHHGDSHRIILRKEGAVIFEPDTDEVVSDH